MFTVVICVVALLLAAVIAFLIAAHRTGERVHCPNCGSNHPRLTDIISDGGQWECRSCGHVWDLGSPKPGR